MYQIKNNGFTLIELVVVIVILGILTVVAAPKFIDLQTDARIATLQGMQGTLRSGVTLIHMKAIIESQTEGDGIVTESGTDIVIHSGYPTGHWDNSMRYIPGLDDVEHADKRTTVCEIEWCGKGNQNNAPGGITVSGLVKVGKVFPKGYSYNDECGVYLINYLDGEKPVIEIQTADCI